MHDEKFTGLIQPISQDNLHIPHCFLKHGNLSSIGTHVHVTDLLMHPPQKMAVKNLFFSFRVVQVTLSLSLHRSY